MAMSSANRFHSNNGNSRPRAVLWAGVSSRPQADKDSIEQQLEDAHRLAELNNWQVVAELIVPGESRSYIDLADAIDGLDSNLRPGETNAYRQLAGMIEKGSFDVLVCRARDRLGRTDSLIAGIEERCRRAGATVYSMQMPSTGQAVGDLYVSAFERAGAQREVMELQRRYYYGMNSRAKRGLTIASVTPFGYRAYYDERGERRLEVVEEEAEALRWAAEQTLDGEVQARICDTLRGRFPERKWAWSSLRYMLGNPVYAGKIRRTATAPNGQSVEIEVDGQHEAILDAGTFQELQAYLDLRRQHRRPPRTSLWSGQP